MVASGGARWTRVYIKQHCLFFGISILLTIAVSIIGYLLGDLMGFVVALLLSILFLLFAPPVRERVVKMREWGDIEDEKLKKQKDKKKK